MLVDDPKSCEDLDDLELNQELCIHITEEMLTSAQNNGCSGTYKQTVVCTDFANANIHSCRNVKLLKTPDPILYLHNEITNDKLLRYGCRRVYKGFA